MIEMWSRRLLGCFPIVTLLFLIAAAHCDKSKAQTSPLTPREFTLSGQRLSLGLPSGAAIRAIPDGKHLRIDVRQSTRHPMAITLRPLLEGEAIDRFDRSEPLGDSRSLNYRVATASVGSGGPEAFLDGHLTVAGRIYVVACHIQADTVTIDDAAWCLPYLRTLIAAEPEVK